MKRRISIIGPIGDVGGRELETGFIAETLSDSKHITQIISTSNFTSNSQLFDFNIQEQSLSLNNIIYHSNIWFRILAWLSYLKSGKRQPLLNYVSNTIAKKTGYKSHANKTLQAIIDHSEIVLLCAQVNSVYVKDIVEYAYNKQVKTVIRTSSTIPEIDNEQKEWLEKVSLFIHHSESNAARLSTFKKHNYTIIDQCTFKEAAMLKLEPVKTFKSVLYIGRLSKEKGVKELIDYYKTSKETITLRVIGNGPLYEELKTISDTIDTVQLLGYKSQDTIIEHIKTSDAIIIPSHEESGPLVGLEAMASARLVISTKVGAMPYRLKDTLNQFWFNIEDHKTLDQVFSKIRKLKASEIETIAKENRAVYLAKYRRSIVENQYKKTIFNLPKK